MIDFSGFGGPAKAEQARKTDDGQERYRGTDVIRGDVPKIMKWFLFEAAECSDSEIIQMRDLVLEDLHKVRLILINPGHASPFKANSEKMRSYVEVEEKDKPRMYREVADLAIDIAVFVGNIFCWEKDWIAAGNDGRDEEVFESLRRSSALSKNYNHYQAFCDPDTDHFSAARYLQDNWASNSFSSGESLYRDPG